MRFIHSLIVLSLATAASAQDTAYSLLPGSQMEREFCLPPCACPYIHSMGPLTGSFSLSLLDTNPLFTRYRLNGIFWYADLGPSSTSMTGTGIYTIGGEVALVHRLELSLTIGALTVITDFDSGFVGVDPAHPFPQFAIGTIAEPVCRRDQIRIIAAPGGTACYANCDGSTAAPVLNSLDFGCFLTRFAAGDAYANCDGSTAPPVLNALDFGCFLTRFAAGCS